jgi:hypothetical protein
MRDEAMNDRDELDLLLDSALATYIDAEAKPGLAQRILAATSQCEPRRPAFRWLAVAVPALAAVLVVAMLWRQHADSPSETAPAAARVVPSASGSGLAVGPEQVDHQVARRAVKPTINQSTPSALPRRKVFPTPTPLAPQEQALMELASRRSEEVPAQVAKSATRSEQPVEPIHIAAIDIPPLNPPDKGAN